MVVKLTKLKELEDALHPNNIEKGFETVINIEDNSFHKPTIGERFTLVGYYNWFSTSMVQEIIDENTFKTCNSIYKWEIINIEED